MPRKADSKPLRRGLSPRTIPTNGAILSNERAARSRAALLMFWNAPSLPGLLNSKDGLYCNLNLRFTCVNRCRHKRRSPGKIRSGRLYSAVDRCARGLRDVYEPSEANSCVSRQFLCLLMCLLNGQFPSLNLQRIWIINRKTDSVDPHQVSTSLDRAVQQRSDLIQVPHLHGCCVHHLVSGQHPLIRTGSARINFLLVGVLRRDVERFGTYVSCSNTIGGEEVNNRSHGHCSLIAGLRNGCGLGFHTQA